MSHDEKTWSTWWKHDRHDEKLSWIMVKSHHVDMKKSYHETWWKVIIKHDKKSSWIMMKNHHKTWWKVINLFVPTAGHTEHAQSCSCTCWRFSMCMLNVQHGHAQSCSCTCWKFNNLFVPTAPHIFGQIHVQIWILPNLWLKILSHHKTKIF